MKCLKSFAVIGALLAGNLSVVTQPALAAKPVNPGGGSKGGGGKEQPYLLIDLKGLEVPNYARMKALSRAMQCLSTIQTTRVRFKLSVILLLREVKFYSGPIASRQRIGM